MYEFSLVTYLDRNARYVDWRFWQVATGPPLLDPRFDGTLPGEQLTYVVNAPLLLRSTGELGLLKLVEMPASGVNTS